MRPHPNPSPQPYASPYLFIATAVTYLFSRYLLIVVLVIYSLLKMAAEKGGVPEAEVVQNRQFITT